MVRRYNDKEKLKKGSKEKNTHIHACIYKYIRGERDLVLGFSKFKIL